MFGLASAWVVACVIPDHHHRQAASEFAPLFAWIGMGLGGAIAWYALFDYLRGLFPAGVNRVPPPNLPVARLVGRRPPKTLQTAIERGRRSVRVPPSL